jgi:hypothetical protein
MVINAAKVAGGRAVKQLKDEGLLGEKCHTEGKASLSCFTTLYRQNIIFSAMVKICSGYYDLWYK